MRLGTVRIEGTTRAAVVGDEAIQLTDFDDVGSLLAHGPPEAVVSSDTKIALSGVEWAPPVLRPNKIVCVGLNYLDHIAEMGNTKPDAPTYFSKFSGALIGANDDIHLPDPAMSTHNDWEVELCAVIGKAARHVSEADAISYVAGYTILNDFSVRDYQRRSKQFLAGKTFEHATPVGPWIVTADELGDGGGLAVTTEVNGIVKQSSTTSELAFGVATLVSDLSQIITLLPGDLIATGTPGGVGAARIPPEWLKPGDELVTRIEGIGELRNRCVLPGASN